MKTVPRVCKSVLAQDPINFDAFLQDSILNLTTGDADKAIAQLEYLNNAYRERPQLLHQLAVAYLAFAGRANPVRARDAVDKAASRLIEAIKLDPRFAEAILLYAELQIRSGNAAVVLDSLVQLVKEQPQIAKRTTCSWRPIGRCRKTTKRWRSCAVWRSDFRTIRNPRSARARSCWRRASARRRATRLMRSVAILPTICRRPKRLSISTFPNKQYAAALERVQQQIDKNPGLGQLWGLRAKIYLAQQDVAAQRRIS